METWKESRRITGGINEPEGVRRGGWEDTARGMQCMQRSEEELLDQEDRKTKLEWQTNTAIALISDRPTKIANKAGNKKENKGIGNIKVR